MKQMAAVKRIGALCGALVLAAGLILSGCEQPSGGGGGGGSEPPVVKKGLSFSKSQANVYAGVSVRLPLSVEGDVSYDDIAVETLAGGWDASYQDGIVTVSAPAGAKKDDSVTVTAYYLLDKAVKSSCTVTVIEKPAVYTEVDTITISGTLGEMKIGDSKKLTAVVTPETATSKDALFWGSSDPAVATVSQDGTVTVVGYGEAEIFAEVTADLKESNKIPVSVKMDIEKLTLEKTKWRSDTWVQNGGVKSYYNLWFVDDKECALEIVFPEKPSESRAIYSSYSIEENKVIIKRLEMLLEISDFGLKMDDGLFRKVAYTEPPEIIPLELAKTKWVDEWSENGGTIWFIDDTHFILKNDGIITEGKFSQNKGTIILDGYGSLLIDGTLLCDEHNNRYTKTEWTPPPEKSALAGTKWESSWYSESDQTTYNFTIWFIDDNFVCFQMGANDMYGTYSVSGQSLSMFGLEAILNKDSISIPEGSIPGISSSLKFLEAEYTSPVYSFGENPLADTSWTEVMSGNYVSFNEDYTCSWQLGTEQKLTGIYYFTRQKYNDWVTEWVTTINPENTQGWASFDINKGSDGSITSLTSADGSLFSKK